MVDTKHTQSPASVREHDVVTLHRQGLTAVDAAIADITVRQGMNMAGYEEAIVEIHADGTANPDFQVFWWSAHSGTWLVDETPLLIAAGGAAASYIVVIPVKQRRMFIRMSGLAGAGSVDVRVAGHRNVIESM